MRLSVLLAAVSPRRVTGKGLASGGVISDPEVTSIHCRADQVRPGGVFVAVRGRHADGHDFTGEALARGAVAVVAEKSDINDAIVAEVDDSRKALALLAADFYGRPAERLKMIGVTGTNGKTTTVALIESILTAGGAVAGVIGTGNFRYRGKTFVNPLTTPDAVDLQRILAEMEGAGVTHVVMEVSSHALDQKRVAGCAYDAAVFTNLTQDHLDYHGTMEDYWACKQLLFTAYLGDGAGAKKAAAVINCNDARGRDLCGRLQHVQLIRVGETGDCQVFPRNVRLTPGGIAGDIVTPAGALSFSSPLCGHYNCENILCAVGAVVALGIANEDIRAGIEAFQGVPGRLERVPNLVNRHVFVDYAHTPDALANVLGTIRAITSGRLFCVFGCGGDRDRKKRPEMGRIAMDGADRVVITSDNPRSEEPEDIIRDILAGIGETASAVSDVRELGRCNGGKRYLVEPDRSRGIAAAVLASRPDDTVVIAGKGSEACQIFRDRTINFDDRLEARNALRLLETEFRPDGARCEMQRAGE
ncbi:MAG: UDP-N-acetylmuramoyl-L-alanyl-D-glutamate--2,6-diaminopimelate ligase [Thermodesulfobacteriota bacterium]